MANGSFGLSGLPTAPTTLAVSSAIKTPLTAATVPISTSTGFQANDLVYFKNGNFGPVPDGSASTATFPVVSSVPTYVQTQNDWQAGLTKIITARNSGINTYLTSVGAVGYGVVQARFNSVATLTNGNLIVVYAGKSSADDGPLFASVFTEEGVLVAGPTFIANAGSVQTNVGVVALPNGNATIWWGDCSVNNKWLFKTLSNTLSTVLADTFIDNSTNGAVTNSNFYCEGAARSDSSVVFIWTNNTNSNAYFKVINSTTGAQVFASTSLGAVVTKANNLAISVRPDDTYVIFKTITSGNITWHHMSGVSALYAGTFTVNAGTTSQWGNAATLSDGRTIISFYNATVGFSQYDIYNGTGTWAGAVSWPAAVTQIPNQQIGAFVTPYSGGVMLSIASTDASTDYPLQPLLYNYNNSFVLQNSTFTRCSAQSMTPQYRTTVVKTANYFHVFSSNQLNVNTGYSYTDGPRAVNWSRVSPTTMLLIPWTGTTASLGNTTAQGVLNYARSNSTPTAAAFFASTTGTVGFTQALTTSNATLIKQQTVIEPVTAYGLDSCTLTNGNVVFVYKTNTDAVKCAVYNNQGVQLTIFNVQTTGVTTSATPRQVSIAALGNGNFVLSYYTTATLGWAWRIYNGTTYGVIASGTNTSSNPAIAQNLYATVSAYDNNRWVLAYISNSLGTNYPFYEVRDATTGSLLSSGYAYTGAATVSLNMVAGGGFLYFHGYTAAFGNWIIITLAETDVTNTFTAFSTAAQGNTNVILGQKLRINQGGAVVYGYPTASNAWNTASYTPGQFQQQTMSFTGINGSTTNIGVTCNGDIVTAGRQDTTTLRVYVSNSRMNQSAGTGFGAIDITGVTSYSGGDQVAFGMTPLFDSRMLMQFMDVNFYPSFVIVNARAYTGSTLLTAGVSVSNAELTLSPTNGFYLTGVSTESASAGGTANVQINGSVALNSNYPSTTTYQAFDFSNPLLYGVKGTIVGRNVTMQGNV